MNVCHLNGCACYGCARGIGDGPADGSVVVVTKVAVMCAPCPAGLPVALIRQLRASTSTAPTTDWGTTRRSLALTASPPAEVASQRSWDSISSAALQCGRGWDQQR